MGQTGEFAASLLALFIDGSTGCKDRLVHEITALKGRFEICRVIGEQS